MQLCVIGSGYVGLVAGACFADSGHDVVCVDSDPRKVEALKQGIIPIYEEGLADVVTRCTREGRLTFTTETAAGVRAAEIIFVAVGTPPGAGGEADLSAVLAVARSVAASANGEKVLVLKSTVPVGTNKRVTSLLKELGADHIEVVNNPEFLKEGAALNDFRRPDRVVVGARTQRARALMQELYDPFVRTGAPILFMDPASAELTKYASNAMLATRISFMNALASICDQVGADIDEIRKGVGTDKRIGPTFLFAGAGYGGSCFPKDVQALAASARTLGTPFGLLDEVERINERQKELLAQKVLAAFGETGLAGKTVAVWGLAFKPNTDDMREAPALTVISRLVEAGARIQAHDPVAIERAKENLSNELSTGRLEFVPTMYDAVEGADALVIVTDWSEYRRPDFQRLRSLLRQPWVFDGRNIWEPASMASRGFHYRCVGRPDARPL